ncbi:MAG: Rne/Rng family ribonuclease [Methyloceanibacter sp.]|uniref:Rne/Rng family ribonuclease n=1 Tax=Methyloceanibacter sp. TaxID=1965321 RepID=UPI003EE1B4DD
MASKMLIDAAHPEETRVVVVKGNRVEEFDYESANKKQLRGNIYLAKVTRVEPSLQAAFVDYGGNRHGFLAFTEIHPDYYQIPVADRQALLEEEAAEHSRASAEEAAEDDEAASGGRRRRGARRGRGRGRGEPRREAQHKDREPEAPEAEADAPIAKFEFDEEDEIDTTPRDEDGDDSPDVALEAADHVHEVSEPAEPRDDDDADESKAAEASSDEDDDDGAGERRETAAKSSGGDDEDEDDDEDNSEDGDQASAKDGGEDSVESVGSEDALEEVPERTRRRRGRPYKIQEVIRRRQIILVQVVKEERGNKGAALTTYLSLAGRYTVLMPNTARGGGISRKITQPTDRKHLREIAGELEVPEGMGLIIRTAGAQRTKTEIKRDYDYLLRLWETVRDLTLESTAPALVYEEGSLIKRSIRDLYNKDIDEVLVAGDDAYREAKDFMRMLMPSHAKNVKPYKEPEPIFIRYLVERQLAAMFSPQVTLKSGGYIVINQTEALVSVDVNSGKATREHNIEDTALKTNLESSDEIARQLRLRDLAGLIVIDFIDMDERRNNRHVEKRLKEALRNDRARIQVGRISHFGLMEMSRQRLRTGVLEGSTHACVMCQGTGIVRSVESVALDILRSIEDRLITDGVMPLAATTAVEVALYILNQKRGHLKDIEARYRVPVTVTADKELHVSQFVIERAAEGTYVNGESAVVQMDWAHHREDAPAPAAEADGEQGKRRPRRRRGRGRGRGEGDERPAAQEAEDGDEDAAVGAAPEETDADGETQPRKSRRRGRRGGRRGRGRGAQATSAEQQGDTGTEDREAMPASEETSPGDDTPAPREERPNGGGKSKDRETQPQADDDSASEEDAPARREPEPAFSVAAARDEPVPQAEVHVESEGNDDPAPRRRGWWSRG